MRLDVSDRDFEKLTMAINTVNHGKCVAAIHAAAEIIAWLTVHLQPDGAAARALSDVRTHQLTCHCDRCT